MDYGVKDKSALIVGGSKGIGFEVAKLLAAESARVAMLARTKTDVDAAVEAIRGQGGTAIGVSADVSHPDDVENAVNVYRESFELHTMSQIFLLRAVLPAMREAGWGRFVHVGSATAKEPADDIHHAVANTSRRSTVGLLKTVSDENARYGITMNTVAPGWIETDNAIEYIEKNLGAGTEQQRREFMLNEARVPAARMGRPYEIASLIAYLCSEPAGYVTGSWIAVDGGLHRSAF